MSELDEERWAVVGERGCEKVGLSYGDAVLLVGQLATENVRGLVIVTEEAGRRILQFADTKTTATDQ